MLPILLLKTFFHYGKLHTKSHEESEPKCSLASAVVKLGLIQFNHICYLPTPSNSPVVNILKEFLPILLLFLLFLFLPIPFSLSLLISTSPLFFPTLPFLFSLSFDFESFCKGTWNHFWGRGLVGFPLIFSLSLISSLFIRCSIQLCLVVPGSKHFWFSLFTSKIFLPSGLCGGGW